MNFEVLGLSIYSALLDLDVQHATGRAASTYTFLDLKHPFTTNINIFGNHSPCSRKHLPPTDYFYIEMHTRATLPSQKTEQILNSQTDS